ncbi:hypothetical protein [Nocardia nepalensis]|uniref:hypothetical protein n=1 Tax=Nocardia nepalensis TaxID=3375448 RepID=UPI003B67B86E
MAPISDLADQIAANGPAAGFVLYVDPDLGGFRARVLDLLDNPGTVAEAGTGSGVAEPGQRRLDRSQLPPMNSVVAVLVSIGIAIK